MKYQIRYILCFILLSACSANVPDSQFDLLVSDGRQDLDTKERLVPYLNLKFKHFFVTDQDPAPTKPYTEEQKLRGRLFTSEERRHRLRSMDYVRFVVNTPEFASNLLATEMYIARDSSGTLGTSKIGDKADPARVLNIIKHANYSFSIAKRQLSDSAIAAAGLGGARYNQAPSEYNTNASFTIMYPNRFVLDEGSFAQDSRFNAGVLLHEIVHTMGFNHHTSLGRKDVVCQTEAAFGRTAEDPEFKKKYSKQLADFRPFYEQRYAKHWEGDIRAVRGSGVAASTAHLNTQTASYASYSDVHSNGDGYDHSNDAFTRIATPEERTMYNDLPSGTILCILKNDGSFELIRL